MNTPQAQGQKWKSAFIIDTVIGVLFLLLSAGAYVLEMRFPDLRGTLAWPFMITAVISLFAAALSHNSWLHAQRHEPETPRTAFRRTSSIKWFGLPLYDIYFPEPSQDIKNLDALTAKGVFAAGMSAKGVIAIGVLARGVFTFGVGSFGVVSVGVCSISLLLAGGVLAIAPYAFGVGAIGYTVAGVMAWGWKVLASVG